MWHAIIAALILTGDGASRPDEKNDETACRCCALGACLGPNTYTNTSLSLSRAVLNMVWFVFALNRPRRQQLVDELNIALELQ